MRAHLTIVALVAVAAGWTAAPANGEPITINQCLVGLIEERDVPAQEGGMLLTLEAREGAIVDAGIRLGTIDDREAVAEREVAARELDVANEQATSDVNVRFAEKSMKVSYYEYKQNEEANKRVKGAISNTEVYRSLFAWQRAELQIEQAKLEKRVAELQAKAAEAKLSATQVKVARRQIEAPISGVIVEIFRKPGTWVNPGDPVLRIIYLERLRVKGRLDANQYSPSELAGRPVTVNVALPGGNRTFTGKVVFGNPQIDGNGRFEFWAEVDNVLEDGQWVLLPGSMGDMTIDLAGAAKPATAKPGAAAAVAPNPQLPPSAAQRPMAAPRLR